jgi:ArsR family transcriptional regulator, lead/cadmium/zinc/bismuth-responsive transcriptional repressor
MPHPAPAPPSPAPQPSQAAIDALLALPTLTPELALHVAQTFGALADATRARIVYALTRSERSVNDLAAIAGVSPSATSHHLKSLRELRLVRFRRAGNRIFYAVDDAHVALLFREALHHLAHVTYGLPDHPPQAEPAP